MFDACDLVHQFLNGYEHSWMSNITFQSPLSNVTANAKWWCTVWTKHANLPDTANLICLLFQLKCPPFTFKPVHTEWTDVFCDWRCCLASSILASCPGTFLFKKNTHKWNPPPQMNHKARPPYILTLNGLLKANIMIFDWLMDWLNDWLTHWFIYSLMDGMCDPMLHSMRLVGGRGPLQPRPLPCCLTNLF